MIFGGKWFKRKKGEDGSSDHSNDLPLPPLPPHGKNEVTDGNNQNPSDIQDDVSKDAKGLTKDAGDYAKSLLSEKDFKDYQEMKSDVDEMEDHLGKSPYTENDGSQDSEDFVDESIEGARTKKTKKTSSVKRHGEKASKTRTSKTKASKNISSSKKSSSENVTYTGKVELPKKDKKKIDDVLKRIHEDHKKRLDSLSEKFKKDLDLMKKKVSSLEEDKRKAQKEMTVQKTMSKDMLKEQTKRFSDFLQKVQDDSDKKIEDLSKKFNSELEDTRKRVNELKNEKDDALKALDDYKKTNGTLLKEYKESKKRNENILLNSRKVLSEQKKNDKFVEEVKKKMEPFKKTQNDLIKEAKQNLKESELLQESFRTLISYTKETNQRNEEFESEINDMQSKLAELEGVVMESSKEAADSNGRSRYLEEEYENISRDISDLKTRINAIEASDYDDKIKQIVQKINELKDAQVSFTSESAKIRQRLAIMDEKMNVYKKHKSGSNRKKNT